MKLALALAFILISALAQAQAVTCEPLLVTISFATGSSAEALVNYKNLLRTLAESSVFSSAELHQLSSLGLVNPLKIVTGNLSPSRRHSFSKAFDQLLTVLKNDDTTAAEIVREYEDLSTKGEETARHRVEAKKITEAVFFPIVKTDIEFPSGGGHTDLVVTLPDGNPLVITSEHGLYLYDLRRETRTLMKEDRFNSIHSVISYKAKSGTN